MKTIFYLLKVNINKQVYQLRLFIVYVLILSQIYQIPSKIFYMF